MKNEQNQIVKTMQALNLPSDQYAVFGSGLMDVLGLKKANDIDLLVTKKLFDRLEQKPEWKRFIYSDGYPGLKHTVYNLELFYESKMPFCSQADTEKKIGQAIAIDGVKFVQLSDILAWKKAFGREKDLRDVALIEYYLHDSNVSTENHKEGNLE